MGFFKLTDVANGIQLYFNPYASVQQQYIFSIVLGAVFFVVMHVLTAIALFSIAKREGYKNKWMAFVPFLSTYYIGVCAQKNGVYKAKTQTISLIATIFEVLSFVACTLSYVASYIMIVDGYVHLEERTVSMLGYDVGVMEYVLNPNVYLPQNMTWLYLIFEYGDLYVTIWLEAVYVVTSILVLISFYKTYVPKNYFLYVLISVFFPVQGLLMFLLRKNKAQNYAEFVAEKQAARYRFYQQYYNNPYANPYQTSQNADKNPYANGNPFDEYGTEQPQNNDEPADPFDEFN